MIAQMPIQFERPIWLALLLLLIPIFLISRRSIGGLGRTKANVTFVLRALVVSGLAIALAQPSWEKRGKGLTATFVIDRSDSLPPALKRSSVQYLQQLVEAKERPEDRVAVVTVGREANVTATPDAYSAVTIGNDDNDKKATNLAAGIRMALAIMPDDTANRIILASDGNETTDSVLAAAELARANDVPIDVLVLEYEYQNEVIFEQIIAPPRARQGQTANIRLVLRSQAATTGTVRLKMNKVLLDLNGAEPGEGLRVELEPGTNVIEQTISLDESGPHQFEGTFIPDDVAADAIDRNNEAIAVTFVGGQGKVLVVNDGPQGDYLVAALRQAGITVETRAPGGLEGGLVLLSGYDAVILVNIPNYALDGALDQMLHAYVHDLGGGLVMIGGAESFGVGGWIDSQVARTLPVELNPPDTRQMPSGALALVMHSCEMPQGNFWGQKVAESAIEALSRLDYAGIIEFNWGAPDGIQGCTWAFPMQKLGDKQAAFAACKTMQVGDMPSFAPSLELALKGLLNTTASQKHTIIISDGDPSPPSPALLQKFVDNKVTITTVMVGGHGTGSDKNRMRAVATKTGGNFHEPKNPKQLPQIFIKEATTVSRSLIQDGDVYQPSVLGNLPGPVQGFPAVPMIDGYVLTAPREGLAQTPIVIATSEGNDPLFAHWNYGLGRTIAYTSDLTNLWGARWASWDRFQAFWEQAIRWVLRPSTPTNMSVITRFEGDTAIIELEALESDASSMNFLQTSALVLRPDAERETMSLRQTGPGRYRTEFKTDEDGAYVINIGFQTPDGDGRQQGSIQAAVNVPYPREFRSVRHNRARLEQLAALTGGRVLTGSDPTLVDVFDRASLVVPRSRKRMWDLLAIIAASLLLVDVAARRISIDPARVRAAAGKAVGKRQDVSTDTVAAWRRTRSQVAHRAEPAKKEKVAAPDRTARFEATEADAAKAIDVGTDEPADGGPKPVKRGPTEAAPDPMEDEASNYTSRLLAAKRRARREEDGGDADG